MGDSFEYAKDKQEKLHANPEFKVGDLVLVSTTNFNNIKVWRNLKDSFAGPFLIKALHEESFVEIKLYEELCNKCPTFTVSLMNPYKSSYAARFSLRHNFSQHIPPVESSSTKKVTKFLKERKLRTKKGREYLVSYS
ncbi:hypothetical protein O181_097568 [Austropuccinia psidii MF-1]|uniref:Uncharacterized protein n=1 Tax=Austropuccinia psidii MF-1 TaxID=1389203 RepID=A0A9Q3PDA9_9BASI|nr:hypothetical protein [Austropuccinia psidii MF-1]